MSGARGSKSGEAGAGKDSARAERLAAELRANLARRKAQKKAQEKARKAPDSPEGGRQSED